METVSGAGTIQAQKRAEQRLWQKRREQKAQWEEDGWTRHDSSQRIRVHCNCAQKAS